MTYTDLPPSPRYQFNGRDFGSVATNTMIQSGAWAAAATVLELYASEQSGSVTLEHGLIAWLVQTTFFLLIKVLAALLRSDGGGWFREQAARLWEAAFRGIRSGLIEELPDEDDNARRRRLIDLLFDKD